MPERIKKITDVESMEVIVPAEPTANTITHENSSTTNVRSAVATSESVFRIPHFASIAVSPAKKADKHAAISHIK